MTVLTGGIVFLVIKRSQGIDRTIGTLFIRMVVDDIQHDLYLGIMQGFDHCFELVDSSGSLRITGVVIMGRKESQCIVSPVVNAATSRQVFFRSKLLRRQ